jgi:glycosyltransferase involved in cell wall biosynthesis
LGLKDAVILAGVQRNTWDYYQAMDVFLMPSLYEGLPVTLVEAQTCGLPCCVSSNVPAEAAITNLVEFRSLEDSAALWAEWILERAKEHRADGRDAICRAGYDIAETSRWLQNYYLEVVKNRGQ